MKPCSIGAPVGQPAGINHEIVPILPQHWVWTTSVSSSSTPIINIHVFKNNPSQIIITESDKMSTDQLHILKMLVLDLGITTLPKSFDLQYKWTTGFLKMIFSVFFVIAPGEITIHTSMTGSNVEEQGRKAEFLTHKAAKE